MSTRSEQRKNEKAVKKGGGEIALPLAVVG